MFSCRLRHILRKLQKDDIAKDDLIKNLEYAASVLEFVYIDETRYGMAGSELIALCLFCTNCCCVPWLCAAAGMLSVKQTVHLKIPTRRTLTISPQSSLHTHAPALDVGKSPSRLQTGVQ